MSELVVLGWHVHERGWFLNHKIVIFKKRSYAKWLVLLEGEVPKSRYGGFESRRRALDAFEKQIQGDPK